MGSTFIGVLRRYAETLAARVGRLYLTGIYPRLAEQLKRTGICELIGDGRVLADAPQLGVAANRALLDAYTWLAKPVRYAEGVAR